MAGARGSIMQVSEGCSLSFRRRGRPGVLVLHSWWGLTESFRTIGERLARAGFTVAVPDMFAGRTATTEAQARALRADRRGEPTYRLLLREAANLTEATGGRSIGIVGYSMGAHWACWLAAREEVRAAAVVLYYGLRVAAPLPKAPPVLAHFAEHDPYVSPAARKRFEATLGSAGARLETRDYPGTRHWFAEPGRPEHDAAASRVAWRATLRFLRENL